MTRLEALGTGDNYGLANVAFAKPLLLTVELEELVGERGFEPPAPTSRT